MSLQSEKYRVIRELGRGGMGVVYLAEDRQLRREVALKVLYEHLNRDSAFVERFQEEARSVSTLHHPNIVCVHGLERSGDVTAIDMEYVDGHSLDQFRRSPTLSPHIVAGVARDVLDGLATCHHIGVVHRDIKPSNILLNQAGQAKITDFGLATAYATLLEETVRGNTSSGFYMGTPRYMPVQAWEGLRPEPFWDLYAFGVVLFELLTGRAAFEGDSPVAILRQHLIQPLPRVQDLTDTVSPAFSKLVERLLASADPDSPDTHAEDALSLLGETPEFKELHSSNASLTVTLPPVRRKAAKPKGSRVRVQWRGPAVAMAAIVLAVVGGILLYRSMPERAASNATVLETPGPAGGSVEGGPVATSAPEVYLDVTSVNNDAMEHASWMVELGAGGYPRRITGLSALELWSLSVDPSPVGERQQIAGFWGACLAAGNRTAQNGTLSGSMLWEPGAGRMTVHVERLRTRDNTRHEISLIGQSKPGHYDRKMFVRELEANEMLQGLLYRELLERRLPWAADIESLMPIPGTGRTAVPHLDASVAPDGVLEEPIWTEVQFNQTGRIGEIPAQTASGEPRLLVRWTNEAVYLAARATGCGASPQFDVGVMPAFDLSVNQSGRFFASVGEQGMMMTRYVAGETEQPWSCDWEGRATVEGRDGIIEVRIPLKGFAESAMPRSGKRWRINARLSVAGEAGARSVVAEWGDADLEALAHGALLVFEP